MGTLSMKQIVAQLFLLVVVVTAVSGQASSSVKGRAMAQLEQWASVQAHCAEASNKEGEIDFEAALECKKCQAAVGDWNTPDGFQRGKACLETWEPKTLEVCGDLFQEYEDSGYDASYTEKMVECWENTYRRDIAAKCLEATGEEFQAKSKEVEACMFLKQSQHYYKDCSAAGGEGVDGFMNFFSCAQNLTLTWVTDKRPEALDMMADYMRGGRIPFGDEEP